MRDLIREELNKLKRQTLLENNEDYFPCQRFNNNKLKYTLCRRIASTGSWLHDDKGLGMKSIIMDTLKPLYVEYDEDEKNKVIKTEEELKNKEEEDTPPEFKVLKAIPSEGITLEALIYKVGESIRDGMGICLKNKWIYKQGDLIMKATSDSFNRDEPKKEPETTPVESKVDSKEEAKKPKTVRKKKTDAQEVTPAAEEKKPDEKKQKAPRKKKTDTTP